MRRRPDPPQDRISRAAAPAAPDRSALRCQLLVPAGGGRSAVADPRSSAFAILERMVRANREVTGEGGLTDGGDLDLMAAGEVRARIEAGIAALIDGGHRPIALGGDHSVTYPV